MAGTPLVVFSHLRWDFVYQRPQHVLSRMAARRRVIVIEEPVHDPSAAARVEIEHPVANLSVVRTHTPVTEPGFCDAQQPVMERMVRDVMIDEGIRHPVAWLYTPMALPLARKLEPIASVYDCMDELSEFLGAPPGLLERETELLRWVDLVFTGGPSLYHAKRQRHPNVHLFTSSVDRDHFAKGRRGNPEASDQAVIGTPRLGFFGVIDERIDLVLLDRLAQARPDWQIVMVGPVVKIDPATLPRHPNLHYLGMRSYDALPGYLAGWDVCLLPFAINRATRFISPTKTLEYMAADHPIVSTPIRDVAEPYRDIVRIAADPDAFIAACQHALSEHVMERESRSQRMRAVLAMTSWNGTAAGMEKLIAAVERGEEHKVEPRRAPAMRAPLKPAVPLPVTPDVSSATGHARTGTEGLS
jgi:UDP-galactopyranose mutase